jgi:hypothetical protein
MPTLQRHILNFDFPAITKFLAQSEPFLIDDEINGFTALQIAAREGLANVVLELLYAGAQIDVPARETPLYLAVKYGHLLVAQILLIHGAKLHLAEGAAQLIIDPTVVVSSLSWGVMHFNIKHNPLALFQVALTKLQYHPDKKIIASALLELAAANNKKELIPLLLPLERHVRHDVNILTPGFWCLKHTDEALFVDVCSKPEEKLLTLRQLHAAKKDKEFVKYYEQWGADIQDRFSQIDATEAKEDQSLQGKVRVAYISAADGVVDTIKKLKLTTDEFSHLIQYAFDRKNFYALQSLYAGCVSPLAVLKKLLEAQQTELVTYSLINLNANLFYFAQECAQDISLLEKLKKYTTASGLIYSACSRGIQPTQPPSDKTFKILKFADNDLSLYAILQLSINNHFNIPASAVTMQDNNRFTFDASISIAKKGTLRTCYSRFGFVLQGKVEHSNKLMNITRDLWQYKIISQLSTNDKASLSVVSKSCREWVVFSSLNKKASELWLINDKLLSVQYKIKSLDEFSEKLNAVLEKQSYWRYFLTSPEMRFLFLLLGAGAALDYGANHLVHDYHEEREVYNNVLINASSSIFNITCSDFSYQREALNLTYPHEVQEAVDHCYYPEAIGAGFVGMLAAFDNLFTVFLIYGLIHDSHISRRYSDAKLNYFPELEPILEKLLNQFKWVNPNPFLDITNRTKIGVIKFKVKEYSDLLQKEGEELLKSKSVLEESEKKAIAETVIQIDPPAEIQISTSRSSLWNETRELLPYGEARDSEISSIRIDELESKEEVELTFSFSLNK